ncbi:MAG: biotin synthase BioB [Actinomycetota bacterium]
MTMDWDSLVAEALADRPPSRDAALAMLALPDEDTLRLVDAGWQVRRANFADRTKVNVLLNAKSGYCPEDCGYCSQSRHVQTPIDRYPVIKPAAMLAAAREAHAAGAQRFCIVAALRGPTWTQVEQVAEATRQIKSELPLEVCACLGLLDEPEKAVALKEAGVDAYNHNLNTSPERYGEITTTHTYEDRLATVRSARAAGLSACSGVILGMGESHEEIVDLAFALREEGADSIPVNFLIPIDGTPMAAGDSADVLTPWFCLRALSMFRLVNPAAELRASAGREIHLRSLQPLAMLVANSLFLGDYLTEDGRSADEDWAMLADLGLIPEDVSIEANV